MGSAVRRTTVPRQWRFSTVVANGREFVMEMMDAGIVPAEYEVCDSDMRDGTVRVFYDPDSEFTEFVRQVKAVWPGAHLNCFRDWTTFSDTARDGTEFAVSIATGALLEFDVSRVEGTPEYCVFYDDGQ